VVTAGVDGAAMTAGAFTVVVAFGIKLCGVDGIGDKNQQGKNKQ